MCLKMKAEVDSELFRVVLLGLRVDSVHSRQVGCHYRDDKRPGNCGRRITDDSLLVPRAVTLEKSTIWMKLATTPVAKKRSSCLNDGFGGEKKSPEEGVREKVSSEFRSEN